MENKFIDKLKLYLRGDELPGMEAHVKMASDNRKRRGALMPPTDARPSAVLILLSDFGEDDFSFPLIQRPMYDGVHGGQMALPGGKRDPEDPSLIVTALRECYEEIGIEVRPTEVLGTLSDLYIPPSNMLVTPVIAYSNKRNEYTLDPVEVDEVIETTLGHLLNPETKKMSTIDVRGMRFNAPSFDIDGKVVWGATAMILSEMLEIVEGIQQLSDR
ncbi:CoA pyrophosphatase [Limibacter armeniacum]|uniref:NUDIX hydrolase n=1 Tax=Limibacter armeniacum TaxID=466084 RepID=UPI002FE65CCD